MTKKKHYEMSPKMENICENRAGSKLPRMNKYKNQIKAEASSIDAEDRLLKGVHQSSSLYAPGQKHTHRSRLLGPLSTNPCSGSCAWPRDRPKALVFAMSIRNLHC